MEGAVALYDFGTAVAREGDEVSRQSVVLQRLAEVRGDRTRSRQGRSAAEVGAGEHGAGARPIGANPP